MLPVFVEISYDDSPSTEGAHLNGGNDWRREGAVSVVEIYDDLLLCVVGNRYVRLPIAIKITDGKAGEMLEVRIYILAGFELKGCGEAWNGTKDKDTYSSEWSHGLPMSSRETQE